MLNLQKSIKKRPGQVGELNTDIDYNEIPIVAENLVREDEIPIVSENLVSEDEIPIVAENLVSEDKIPIVAENLFSEDEISIVTYSEVLDFLLSQD